MRRSLTAALLMLPLIACNQVDAPKLLAFAKFGIEADCAIGTDALAKDVCVFGTDAIDAATAAVNNDPQGGIAAAKQILIDASVKQPTFAPYVAFLMVKM